MFLADLVLGTPEFCALLIFIGAIYLVKPLLSRVKRFGHKDWYAELDPEESVKGLKDNKLLDKSPQTSRNTLERKRRVAAQIDSE